MNSKLQILLTGVGSYLPKNKTSNSDLEKFMDTSDEWIKKRTGIKFRHFVEENELLNILNPIIKSDSMWKPHAMYLIAEFYLSKNQKQKSKEFFNQIIAMENISPKIKLEVQKRLRSDFGE